MRNKIQLVGPAKPYTGIATFPDPSILGVGKFPIGQNLRSRAGTPTVRNGIDKIAQHTLAETNPYNGGMWMGYTGGQYRKIGSCNLASASKSILFDIDTGTEITAGSGKFGDTRLTTINDTQYQPQFTPITDRLNGTYKILVSTGTDYPSVVYHDGSAWVCCPHIAIDPSLEWLDETVQLQANGFFSFKSNAYTTLTDSGGGLSSADDNSKYHPYTATAGNAVKFTASTSTASGDHATITQATLGSIDCTGASQLWLVLDTWMSDWLDSFAVSLGKSGSYTTIWDPTSVNYTRPVRVALDGTTKALYAINLDYDTINALSTVDAIRFTYKKGFVPDAAINFWVIAAAFSGVSAGGTQIACSRYNPYSHAESPASVFALYNTPSIEDIGGPALRGLRVPNIPELKFDYNIPTTNPSSAETAQGVSTIRVYARIHGATKFLLTNSYALTSYSGGWSYGSGSADSALRFTTGSHGSEVENTLQPIEAPDALTTCIPADCYATCATANRLIVCASTTSYERYDTVWFSDFNYPYRMRKTVQLQGGAPVEESGFTVTMSGESAKASVASATGSLLGSIVYILTDSSVYAASGIKFSQLSQFSRVSPYGLMYYSAVAEHDGMLAWHSTNSQIVLYANGSAMEISYNTVDDRLDPIAVSPLAEFPPVVAMAFRDSKLYVAIRHTTSANYHADKVLVYDMRLQSWVGEDVFPTGIKCKSMFRGEGGSKELVLYFCGIYGDKFRVFEYDSPGLTQDEADAGNQDIDWTLRTSDMSLGPEMPRFTVGRVAVFCDKQASGTIDIVRGYRPGAYTATSSINLSASTDNIYKVDGTITCSDLHMGATAYVELSGSSPAGFQIFNAYAEIENRGEAPSS